MSIHENLQCYPPIDIQHYLALLSATQRVAEHPKLPRAFIVNGLPCFQPQQAEDHTFMLSFNYWPLPDILLQVLIDHPEDFLDDLLVSWTQEQELILEASLGELR